MHKMLPCVLAALCVSPWTKYKMDQWFYYLKTCSLDELYAWLSWVTNNIELTRSWYRFSFIHLSSNFYAYQDAYQYLRKLMRHIHYNYRTDEYTNNGIFNYREKLVCQLFKAKQPDGERKQRSQSKLQRKRNLKK